MVFILWIFIFYYSGLSNNVDEFIEHFRDYKIIGSSLIVAILFGVIIHQISVMIKNYITVGICKEFDDFPKNHQEAFKENPEYTKYILMRISNLNSFYYVRFDNGFLAPVLALILIVVAGYDVSKFAMMIFLIVSTILLSYIHRICQEMKKYNELLNKSTEQKPDNSHCHTVCITNNSV